MLLNNVNVIICLVITNLYDLKCSVLSRDGTIALLDQMVGTTTKATSRQVTTNGSINPATQAAILAAAAVAQVFNNTVVGW